MGEEPKPKEGIFSITAEEIPVLIGGDEQHSSDSPASRLVGTDGTEGMGSPKTALNIPQYWEILATAAHGREEAAPRVLHSPRKSHFALGFSNVCPTEPHAGSS